ncbi:hypothetical protein [Micrococcus luteus]|uniref:hypothetical protein n=1 Tax=Micrococcus luteus TaxID=1270 RepID=UPI00117D3630|nr:hypothetical protein [Micrococcus luteus]
MVDDPASVVGADDSDHGDKPNPPRPGAIRGMKIYEEGPGDAVGSEADGTPVAVGSGTPNSGKNDDKYYEIGESVIRRMGERQHYFADAYPFRVLLKESHAEVASRTPARDLYIYLLWCSLVNKYGDTASRVKYTNSFEVASAGFMEHQLPMRACVKVFGVNSSVDEIWPTKLKEKIESLAAKLRLATQEFTPGDFSDHNVGDGGLDVVGWVDNGDEENRVLVALGQCATGADWRNKQSSASAEQWGAYINFRNPPVVYLFVPHDLRDECGKWRAPTKFRGTIPIDRLRFVRSLVHLGDEVSIRPTRHRVGYVVKESADEILETLRLT